MAKKGACKICDSKNVAQINGMIRNGATTTIICKTYGLNYRTLKRHIDDHMSQILKEDKKAKDLLVGDSLIKSVERNINCVEKLVAACDDYLTDPDDPTKYFIGARGDDIDVVYRESDPDGDSRTRKAPLQSLMNAINDDGHYVVLNMSMSQKVADPRELLLKGIKELKDVVKMLLETTQYVLENEHKNKAISKAVEDGESITFEKEMQIMTERIIIARDKSNSEELSELAGLPEL